jgi:hypothetical protein
MLLGAHVVVAQEDPTTTTEAATTTVAPTTTEAPAEDVSPDASDAATAAVSDSSDVFDALAPELFAGAAGVLAIVVGWRWVVKRLRGSV